MKFGKKSFSIVSIQYLLLCAWIFVAPTNLFWKILPNFGFVGGLQIDYLIPKLYLSDVVGLMMIAVWFFAKMHNRFFQKNAEKQTDSKYVVVKLLFILCYVLLFVRQLFTRYPIAAVWFFLSVSMHLATVLIAFEWLKKNGNEFWKKILVSAVAFTVLFQSAIGIYQFVNQKQLIGFRFLGEPTLTRDIGLSKGNFAKVDSLVGTKLGLRVLPYGTTAHPNVLAGFLVIGMLGIMLQGFSRKMKLGERAILFSALIIGTGTLLLTNSVSAGLTFFIGTTLITFEAVLKKFTHTLSFPRIYILDFFIAVCIAIPVGVHFLNTSSGSTSTSLSRRDFLNQGAVNLISLKPLIGTGMNQFTVEVALSSQNQKETVPFIQPAHHTPLLFLAENGLLGLLTLILFGIVVAEAHSLRSLKYFVVLLPIMTLDHYLYSLTPGQFIFELGWVVWLL